MFSNMTAVQLSGLMSKIHSKNTKPEMLVRQYLHGQGFRYRLHTKTLPGSPDIVLPKYKTAVIIQGCFWHRHGDGCGINAKAPRSNTSYWGPKLERNVQRDARTHQALRDAGWRVLVVWECELKRGARGATLSRLTADIIGDEWQWESNHHAFD